MAEIKRSELQVEVTITLKMSENEARALEAITSYGAKEFLKVFYQTMGKFALEKYEPGLLSLFESVSATMPAIFQKIDDARKILKEAQK